MPQGDQERSAYLLELVKTRNSDVAELYRERLITLYGAETANRIRFAEAFELSEYGRQATVEELQVLFPGFD